MDDTCTYFAVVSPMVQARSGFANGSSKKWFRQWCKRNNQEVVSPMAQAKQPRGLVFCSGFANDTCEIKVILPMVQAKQPKDSPLLLTK